MAYKRWEGTDFKRDVAEFGESAIQLKPGAKGKDKHDCRWEQGVWLGFRDETREIIIGMPDGFVKSRDVQRRAAQEDR